MTPKDPESARARVRTLEQQIAERDRRLAAVEGMLGGILSSRSWRWTEALRSLAWRRRSLGSRNGGGGLPSALSSPPTGNEAPNPVLAKAKHSFTELSETILDSFLASGSRLTLSGSSAPLVSIVLVVYNRAELTLHCLRSIAEVSGVPLELIVVDNASTDRTRALFDRVDGVRYFQNDENLFFISAVNRGARASRGKYLLLLNNDAVLLPGAINSMVTAIESASDIGGVGGKIIFLDGTLQEAGNIIWRDGTCLGYGRGDDPIGSPYMFRRDVDYCSGALLLLRKDLFDRLGGFDEAYSPAYYEETDYCLRLWQAGYRVVYEPAAAILHYEFASRDPAHASQLQVEKREVFVGKHSDVLAGRLDPSDANILRARQAGTPRTRILLVDDRVPHPRFGSGFPRSHRLLTGLVDYGAFVTLYPLAAYEDSWTQVYADIPGEVEVMMNHGPAALEDFLRTREGFYDLVVVSRPHNMRIMAGIIDRNPSWFARTKIVYDAEALFSTRVKLRRSVLGAGAVSAEPDQTLEDELALAKNADAVLSISEAEAGEFRRGGVAHVEVLSHALDVTPTPDSFDDRSGLLFVGAIYEEGSPNGDSMIWFIEHILPRIQDSLPDIRLTLVGINASERIWSLASEQVSILGPMEDLGELYATHRIFVAPTRFAAGVPLKIYEAAAFGVPVVATSILAVQLGWRQGRDLAVADSPVDFARTVVELYRDRTLWNRIRTEAIDRVRRDCSPRSFDETLQRVIEQTTRA